MTDVYQTPQGVIVTYDELIPMVRLDRTLWLTEDKSHVVEDLDPEAAHLYGNEGRWVPRSEAEKLGAMPKSEEKQKEPMQAQQPTEEQLPKEKQAPKPADKKATTPENK